MLSNGTAANGTVPTDYEMAAGFQCNAARKTELQNGAVTAFSSSVPATLADTTAAAVVVTDSDCAASTSDDNNPTIELSWNFEFVVLATEAAAFEESVANAPAAAMTTFKAVIDAKLVEVAPAATSTPLTAEVVATPQASGTTSSAEFRFASGVGAMSATFMGVMLGGVF